MPTRTPEQDALKGVRFHLPPLFLLARLGLLQLGPISDPVFPLALGFQHGLPLGFVGKKLDRYVALFSLGHGFAVFTAKLPFPLNTPMVR